MAYKLYTDKSENFECEVTVKNASLKGSIARLIVESVDGINLIFNGKIESGKCKIPIRRLKGLLDENTNGKMKLEVIVEDTYFSPWSDNFIVEEHTSVKVKVNEQMMPAKPSIKVKVLPNKKQVMSIKENLIPIYELSQLCKKFSISKTNIVGKKKDFRQLVKEYFQSNPEYSEHKSIVLHILPHFLK